MKAYPVAACVGGPKGAANNVGQKSQAATHKCAQNPLRPCLCNLPDHLHWQQQLLPATQLL